MSSPGGPPQKPSIDINKELLKWLKEVDIHSFIGTISDVLLKNSEIARDPTILNNANYIPPNKDDMKAMEGMGFDIDPDGVVYGLKDIEYTSSQIIFLSNLSLALSEFDNYVNAVGKNNLVNFANLQLNQAQLSQAIQANNQFVTFLINTWDQFNFTENGRAINKGEAILKIMSILFLDKEGVFRTWYSFQSDKSQSSKSIYDFLLSFNNGVGAAFSAYLHLRNQGNKVELSNEAQDRGGIDLIVVSNTGNIFCQVKSMPSDYDSDSLSKVIEFKDREALIKFINDYVSSDKVPKMLEAVDRVINYSDKNKGKWSWIFITGNYYRGLR